MPNSKTFLQAILAAFCAILCALSGMGGGGMMIGARTAAWAVDGKKVPTAADYQGELIALWDGIENVADGQHDGSSPEWIDLIGGRRATLTAHGSWAADALVCDGVGFAASDGLPFARSDVGCVEVVADCTGDGLICYIAGRDGLSGGGDIFVWKIGDTLQVNSAEGASYGFTNRVSCDSSVFSASIVYDARNPTSAIINGVGLTPYYQFGQTSTGHVEFGGRSSFSDIPFAGKIKSVRVFSSITDAQRAANYAIDKARFGLP